MTRHFLDIHRLEATDLRAILDDAHARKAARKGWEEALADPALWPPKWADTWFKGTGRSIENEVYFNTAQKPLIESPGGIFSMSEEDIEKNIAALDRVGIKGTRAMFDTTLLAELG